jgi:protein TonB
VSTAKTRPQITHSDRFAFTVCFAILLHAIIVLGVIFVPDDGYQPRFDTMDIILVQQSDNEAPEDPTHLAQANNTGGGDTDEAVTPTTPLPPPFPDNVPEITTPPTPQVEPSPAVEEIVEVNEEIQREKKQEEKLLAESDTADNQLFIDPTERQNEITEEKAPRKTAAELLTNSFKIASLSAQIENKLEAKSKRPRRRFISASTKAYKYASYMEAWRAKVERVGNLNYPEQARKNKLSGNLILDVALNPDGSISEITIRRSSGHKVLDDAAIRIVELASPFSPFPDNISKETDILHITRTWQFLNNRGFR